MSFLGLGFDINDVPEMPILPAGEHKMRINKATYKVSRNDPGLIVLTVQFVDPTNPEASAVYHRFCIPTPNALPKGDGVIRMWKLQLQAFMGAFNPSDTIDISNANEDDQEIKEWEGCEGFVNLKVVYNEEMKSNVNEIKGFIIPKDES